MSNPNYDLKRCFSSASKAFSRNIVVVLLTVSILPLPSFVLWMEAPLPLLCLELTLLDCYYFMAAVLLIYGMFGATCDKISIGSVLSTVLKPGPVLIRSWQFFFSESPGIWKSLVVMILGVVFGLAVQWLAGPWKLPPEQNLIGALIYSACLLFWSQDLVGWMLAPYYLANLSLKANEAYKRSHFADKGYKYWNLRLTAVFCIIAPALLFGAMRYLLLKPADFENFQLNLPLNYFTSIVPWMLAVFSLFLWNEIYKQRIAQDSVPVESPHH